MLTPKQAVTNGAAILDKRRSTWYTKIDLKILRIENECDCIAGQLWGHYWNHPEYIGRSIDEERKNGFVPPFIYDGKNWCIDYAATEKYIKALNREWKKAIRLRLAGGL